MANDSGYHIKSRDSMETVDVVFVSDELVGSTIVSKKDYERLMRQKIKSEVEKLNLQKNNDTNTTENKNQKRKGCYNNSGIDEINSKRSKYENDHVDDVELALAALENDDVEKVEVTHPTTLFDENDVLVKEICNFKNNVTPKKSKITDNLNHCKDTNICQNEKHKERKLPTILEDPNQTPFTLRKKVIRDIKEIQKILETSDESEDFSGSDSDDSYKLSDSSLSDSVDNNSDKKLKHSKESKSFFQSYCDLQSSKKSSLSVNSLKKLKNPQLTQEKLDEIVKNIKISSTHKNCIKNLFSEILELFNKWDFVLKQNFNILLYGAGSKKEIIEKYVNRFSDVSPVIIVNGFFPDISCKEIIEKICSILNISVDSSDLIEKIQSKIINYELEIYLAINNIDGIMLRSNKTQSMISQLGKIQQIHILASIDHINAPLIWDKKTCSEFNWVWYDCTTFLNYTEEILYEGNLMLQNSGKATLLSLRNVFNSLTINSRGIFLIIVKNQLEGGNKKLGISFRELYQECRKELLISSDVALRSQLKEFVDHMILKQKKNVDGEENFIVTMENNILKQFLEEQEAKQS